jgi:hypothetical protein
LAALVVSALVLLSKLPVAAALVLPLLIIRHTGGGLGPWDVVVGLALGAAGAYGLHRLRLEARARHLLRHEAKLVDPRPHELVRAQLQSFGWVDHDFYAGVEKDLGALGFRSLGDIEDRTLSRMNPPTRTFLRLFLSQDGAIVATCAHIRVRGLQGLFVWRATGLREIRLVELGSCFPDGTEMSTSNGRWSEPLKAPPHLLNLRLPRDTATDELVRQHRARLAGLAGAHGAPVLHETLEQVLDTMQTSFRRQADYRRKTTELRRFLAPGADDPPDRPSSGGPSGSERVRDDDPR